MRSPNFFIIGAPKCGTTSVATWLSSHPLIFMCPRKEPHHFDTDHAGGYRDRSKYDRLFAEATDQHVAVGEASVWYLFSREAVRNIEVCTPGARYIVCLRNPIDMAHSLHEQSFVNGDEHIADFAEAWRLWPLRAEGKHVSRSCKEPSHLAYGAACSLGEQMERLFAQVPRERVLPIVIDDVKRDPRAEYRRLLSFLGVNDDGRTAFPAMNPAKRLRSKALNRAVRMVGRLKGRLGLDRSLGLLKAVQRVNIEYRPRAPMPPAVREELRQFFEADIEKLGGVLHRDLSPWLTTTTAR